MLYTQESKHTTGHWQNITLCFFKFIATRYCPYRALSTVTAWRFITQCTWKSACDKVLNECSLLSLESWIDVFLWYVLLNWKTRTIVIWNGWAGLTRSYYFENPTIHFISIFLYYDFAYCELVQHSLKLLFSLPSEIFSVLSKLSLCSIVTRLNKHSEVSQNNWNRSRINQRDCKRLYRWLLLSFCNSSLKHFFCVFLIRI